MRSLTRGLCSGLAALLVLFLFFVVPAFSLPPPAHDPPLSFSPPEVKQWVFPQGLTVFFHEDHELPLVQGNLYLPGGTLWELQPGAALAMGALLRDGGAGDFSPEELDRRLYSLGAEVSSQYEEVYGRIGFRFLSSDFSVIFSIVTEVAARPRFDEDRIDLWKKSEIEAIRRRRDNPETVAEIAFKQLLFGDSQYGRVLSSSDVSNINREALIRSFKRMVGVNGAILALSGDLEVDRVLQAARDLLTALPALPGLSEAAFAAPPLRHQPTPGLYFIEMPFSQATVRIGEQGPPRHSPDEFAIKVFNDLFGTGGLESALISRVRARKGLAYSVYGGIFPEQYVGQIVMAIQTKAESTGAAIMEAKEVLADFRKDIRPAVELQASKSGLIDSFVFKFERPQEIVDRAATLKLLQYPASYDKRYVQSLMAVKGEAVRKAALERWDPEKFIIVVVGNKSSYNSLAGISGLLHPGAPIHELRFGERLEVHENND